MKDHHFKSGQNPMTGEKALRTTVYELLQQIAGVEFCPHDLIELVPSADPIKVKDALRGLVHNPEAYPGIHRVGRGRYIFDPNRPQQWMTFPNMARRRRVGKRVVKISKVGKSVVKTNPVLEAFAKNEARDQANSVMAEVATQQAPIAGVQRLGQFVEVVAMFDRASGRFLPTDEAVLLRDDKGCFWQATRV